MENKEPTPVPPTSERFAEITNKVYENEYDEFMDGFRKAAAPMENEELAAAIKNFEEINNQKTFSQRNPQLGRMVNCHLCNLRHRSVFVCTPRYAATKAPTLAEDGTILDTGDPTPRMNETIGNFAFRKKRFHPHPNKRSLQLVERTKILFDDYLNLDAVNAMKAARVQASRELRLEYKERANGKRRIQKASRRGSR